MRIGLSTDEVVSGARPGDELARDQRRGNVTARLQQIAASGTISVED